MWGTASFNLLQLSLIYTLHQKYLNLWTKRRGCQNIVYDVGGYLKILPFKKYPLQLPPPPPPHPAVYIMNAAGNAAFIVNFLKYRIVTPLVCFRFLFVNYKLV